MVSSHKALHSEVYVQSVDVHRSDFEKPANARHVSSWNEIHSSFQQSKLVYLVVNVTTFLHVGQDHSNHILSGNPTPIQARDQACGQHVFCQDLENTSDTRNIWEQLSKWESVLLGLHQKTAVCVSLEAIKLSPHDQLLHFHVGSMHNFLPMNGLDYSHRHASMWQMLSDWCWN